MSTLHTLNKNNGFQLCPPNLHTLSSYVCGSYPEKLHMACTFKVVMLL